MKRVRILGPGCPRCEQLKQNAETAVRQLGIDAAVELVTDMDVITSFGVMMLPALVIGGEVRAVGKVLSAEEIRRLLGPISRIVIPARLASTRLPRKLLLRETGKSLIEHTYEAACRATRPDGVCVATDHREIFDEVRRFGGQVEMTDPNAPSGTDRVAEVARRMTGVEIVVNVQGDEPELSGTSIDLAIRLLEERPDAVMSTLATPIRSRRQLEDPACVKVVFDASGRAMYFSRSPIPCARQWDDALLSRQPPCFYQHVGLYAYRREFLLQLAQMPPSPLEQIERLEQLRVLEAGHAILVGVVDEPTFGIDTPEDYRAFVEKTIRNR